MPVRMACFTFGSGTEYRGDVIESLDVRLGSEVQITPIRLRFACERVLQILFRLTTFQIHGSLLPIENFGINMGYARTTLDPMDATSQSLLSISAIVGINRQ
jgi:hypothetical protein